MRSTHQRQRSSQSDKSLTKVDKAPESAKKATATPESVKKTSSTPESVKTASSTSASTQDKPAPNDKFLHLFGFSLQNVASLESFVKLMCRPCDPSSLGTIRFIYGMLMVLDILEERGLSMADTKWGNTEDCRFPLFNFLHPLPLEWMYIVYLVMLLGAVGIMLGFKFRLSSALFLATYWYLFFLDKTTWNNHSYLFGILGFLLAISDANRYWSLDGILNPDISNAHVPLWNYTLLRAQMFVVYFIAGLKKLDLDWISGYSMQSLSNHHVFYPVRLLLTEEQVDFFIVHLGGLIIDLSSGFLLFFDQTRLVGLVITTSFHLLNSQLFGIGMFPFMMLGCQLIFCHITWPRSVFNLIPASLRLFTPEDAEFHMNPHCIYPKECSKSESAETPELHFAYTKKPPAVSPTAMHKAASIFTISFIGLQFFLPYSHGITQGYNNWTNGLYGYSWDMMVHAWSIQHIQITYVDLDKGKTGYLKPDVWTRGRRWHSNGDMIKQYAVCIADHLQDYNISNVAVYFDIWISLNSRFQQRLIDPRVDMVRAEWSPFRRSEWIMPLMVDLSDWRTKLEQITHSLGSDNFTDVVFVADFPGMHLENFIVPDYANTSLTVLSGQVVVEIIEEDRNVTLLPDQSVQLTANTFHNVHTVSASPSCYMYMYENSTDVQLWSKYKQFEEDVNNSKSLNGTVEKYRLDPNLAFYQQTWTSKQNQSWSLVKVWDNLKSFLRLKHNMLMRSIRLSTGAVYCLLTRHSFSTFLNTTYQWEQSTLSS